MAFSKYEVSVSLPKEHFLRILRGTGMMIVTVVHFILSAQTLDGQNSLDFGRRLMLLPSRASRNWLI